MPGTTTLLKKERVKQNNCKMKLGPDLPVYNYNATNHTHNLSNSIPNWAGGNPLRLATINLSLPTFRQFKDIKLNEPLRMEAKFLYFLTNETPSLV